MTERNWAANHTYRASTWHRPVSVEEVQSVVAAAEKIGVVGSRHSFNGLGDAPEIVDLGALPKWLSHGEGSDEVTFAAHMTYAELASALEGYGLALANLASLPHISVAGAIATGTHGSGSRNGNLATAVRGLRTIRADGSLVDIDPEALDGSVVSLGLTGIVESVTLAVEPAYEVAQFVYEGVSWDAVRASFEELFASAYSVSVFTRWSENLEQVWLKFRADDERLVGHRSGQRFFGGHTSSVDRHPILELPADAATEQRGRSGPWNERLPHFRAAFQPSAGEEIQSEFFVALHDGAAAFDALRRIGRELADTLLVSEVRTVAADSLWMSPAYRRDSAAFHFTWRRDAAAVDRSVGLVEETLAPFAPRPHWGKVFHPAAFDVAASYERSTAFGELLSATDPDRCFANGWSAALFGR